MTRNVTGPDGDLAATTRGTTITVQLTDLHGDITATITVPKTGDPATITTFRALRADEFGNPLTTTTGRYGWLGAKQRSTETLTGLILMGVRLYAPTLGRFLSVDPIPGGNDNPYVYPPDPINKYDLDGKCLDGCAIEIGAIMFAAAVAAALFVWYQRCAVQRACGAVSWALGNPIVAHRSLSRIPHTDRLTTVYAKSKRPKLSTELKGAEHKTGARKSTQPTHERGQTRKGRDQGGEKKDKRMRY